MTTDGRFDGRVALITGASRGIGLAIAAEWVERGGAVTITARKPEQLDAAVAELGGGDRVLAVPGNAADPAHRAEAVQRTLDTFGRLDGVVANVGINPVFGPLIDADLDAVRKIFDTNYVATLALIQRAWRSWMADNGGSILVISSVAALRNSGGIGAYGSSKAALQHLVAHLAIELAPKVRINAVAPAVVKTRFAEALYAADEAAAAARYPLQRLGEPADVAKAAAFLLSDESGWITGQTLVIDGGANARGGL